MVFDSQALLAIQQSAKIYTASSLSIPFQKHYFYFYTGFQKIPRIVVATQYSHLKLNRNLIFEVLLLITAHLCHFSLIKNCYLKFGYS